MTRFQQDIHKWLLQSIRRYWRRRLRSRECQEVLKRCPELRRSLHYSSCIMNFTRKGRLGKRLRKTVKSAWSACIDLWGQLSDNAMTCLQWRSDVGPWNQWREIVSEDCRKD